MRSFIFLLMILMCSGLFATEATSFIVSGDSKILPVSSEGTGEVCIINSIEDDIFAATDPRKDWRKNKDASWYNELGEFPEKVAIFGGNSLKIYDINSLSTPFMTFSRSASNYMIADSTSILKPFTAIEMHNGILYISTADGLRIIDFINDKCYKVNATAWYIGNKRISDRNKAISFSKDAGKTAISSNTINCINANTVSAVDYVLIANGGGLNQYTISGENFGTFYSVTDAATYSAAYACELASGGEIYFTAQDSATSDEYGYLITKSAILSANITDYSNAGLVRYGYDGSTLVNVALNKSLYSIFSLNLLENKSEAESGKDAIILGCSNEISRLDIDSTAGESYLRKMGLLYNMEPVLGSTFSVFAGLNSSDDEADLSYRNNDLTAVGTLSATGSTNYPNYYAVDFDGLTNALTSESADFILTDEVFISCWIKPDDGQPETNEAIVSIYDADTAAGRQYYIMLSTGGSIEAYVKLDDDSQISCESEAIFSDGAVNDWYHIALSFKQNTDLTLYINGEISAQATGFNNQPLKTSVTTELQVGSFYDSEEDENQFAGLISSVQILHQRPTSVSNYIKSIYNHGRNSLGRKSILSGSSSVITSISEYNNDLLISSGDNTNKGVFQLLSKKLNNYYSSVDFTDGFDCFINGNKNDYIYIKEVDGSNLSGKINRGSFNIQGSIQEK